MAGGWGNQKLLYFVYKPIQVGGVIGGGVIWPQLEWKFESLGNTVHLVWSEGEGVTATEEGVTWEGGRVR